MRFQSWPRMIQRNFQRRQIGEFILPIGAMNIERRLLRAVVLPDCIIRELKWQFRQYWGAILDESGIVSSEFIAKNSDGPTIGNDVVHSDEQHVLLLGKLQEASANQRSILQIESAFSLLDRQAFLLRISFGLRQAA